MLVTSSHEVCTSALLSCYRAGCCRWCTHAAVCVAVSLHTILWCLKPLYILKYFASLLQGRLLQHNDALTPLYERLSVASWNAAQLLAQGLLPAWTQLPPQVQQTALAYVEARWGALKLEDTVKTALALTHFVDTGGTWCWQAGNMHFAKYETLPQNKQPCRVRDRQMAGAMRWS